jgi:hypothetical protein
LSGENGVSDFETSPTPHLFPLIEPGFPRRSAVPGVDAPLAPSPNQFIRILAREIRVDNASLIGPYPSEIIRHRHRQHLLICDF